jgi:hypothetical protein
MLVSSVSSSSSWTLERQRGGRHPALTKASMSIGSSWRNVRGHVAVICRAGAFETGVANLKDRERSAVRVRVRIPTRTHKREESITSAQIDGLRPRARGRCRAFVGHTCRTCASAPATRRTVPSALSVHLTMAIAAGFPLEGPHAELRISPVSAPTRVATSASFGGTSAPSRSSATTRRFGCPRCSSM